MQVKILNLNIQQSANERDRLLICMESELASLTVVKFVEQEMHGSVPRYIKLVFQFGP